MRALRGPAVIAALLTAASPWACRGRDAPAASARTESDAAAGASTTTTPRKRLVLGTLKEPTTLCAHVAADHASREVAGLLTRDLVVHDPTWSVRPELAADVPAAGATSDGRITWTWRLRDDARWEDGTPLRARDVLLTWKLQRDPLKQKINGREEAARIEAIAPLDDERGFVVTWKRPPGTAVGPRLHTPLPAHVLERALEGPDGGVRSLADHAYCAQPLSSGPFKLTAWTRGVELKLERNPHAAPPPLLDEVVVRVFSDARALEAALLAGAVDATLPEVGLSTLTAVRFVRAHPDRFELVTTPGQAVAHIDFNLEDPLLADLRIREAVALAVPREKLFHAASDGALAPVDTYLPPQHPMYAPVDPIRYDPVRAAALLEDAGFFVPAQGGPRARADGTVLRFTIDAGNEKEETEELLQGIRSALAAVGIELEPRLRPFKELSDSLASGRTQRQLTFYSWASMPSVLGTGLFRADRIPTAENDFVGANTTGYRNDDVTALLKRVDESTDEAERKAAIAAALRLLRRDLPVLPLYVRAATVVVRKGVKNLRPTGTVTPLAWNAARWDVDVRAP